jgi:hypothetical protein
MPGKCPDADFARADRLRKPHRADRERHRHRSVREAPSTCARGRWPPRALMKSGRVSAGAIRKRGGEPGRSAPGGRTFELPFLARRPLSRWPPAEAPSASLLKFEPSQPPQAQRIGDSTDAGRASCGGSEAGGPGRVGRRNCGQPACSAGDTPTSWVTLSPRPAPCIGVFPDFPGSSPRVGSYRSSLRPAKRANTTTLSK